MKLEPVTKIDKRNKTASRKSDDDAMSENCDVIAFFLIYSYLGAIPMPDFGWIGCKTYIFINNNCLSYKN